MRTSDVWRRLENGLCGSTVTKSCGNWASRFARPVPVMPAMTCYSIENYFVEPGKRVLVESGLHLEIPSGYVGLVKDRSSVASAGLHTLAGVIDSAYRGELKISDSQSG